MYDIVTLNLADEFRSFQVGNMILNPNLWARYPDRLPLNWNSVKFHSSQLENVPNDEHGVYSFVVIPEIANHIACAYLLYVGKTDRSFHERYWEYLYGQRTGKNIGPHKYEMLIKWRDHLWFCYAPILTTAVTQIKQIEDDLLVAYLPPYNKQFPASVRGPMGVLR